MLIPIAGQEHERHRRTRRGGRPWDWPGEDDDELADVCKEVGVD